MDNETIAVNAHFVKLLGLPKGTISFSLVGTADSLPILTINKHVFLTNGELQDTTPITEIFEIRKIDNGE